MIKVAIIVEWENIVISETARAASMLRELATQIASLPKSLAPPRVSEIPAQNDHHAAIDVSTVIVFDPDTFDEEQLRHHHRAILKEYAEPRLVYLPVPGEKYYQLKNQAGRAVAADLLVFLDSDSIPEPMWLSNMIVTFDDPKVDVVAGNSYIDPSNLFIKAFAVAWFFPLRASAEKICPTERFCANNVAFKRDVFLNYPFPPVPGTTRGSCVKLARTLQCRGMGLYQNTAAQVSHPAPNGWTHFVIRALSQGRNRLMPTIEDHGRRPWMIRTSFGRLVHDLASACKGILENHFRVQMGPHLIPLAIGQMTAYYLLVFTGSLLTWFSPAKARHWFQL